MCSSDLPRLTNPGVRLRVGHQHSRFLSILTRFVDYNSPIWRSQSDFHGCRSPRCAYVLVVKTRGMGRFSPVSWTITQFCAPEVISKIDEPRVAFTCRSSTLTILVNSGRLVNYYSLFWGPGVNSTIDETRGASTWLSPTLAFLVDYGPFHGLLLTVLGSCSDFHSY